MKAVGVVGLGDMGSGLTLNLLKAGFDVRGYDLKPERMAAFKEMGGTSCNSSAEVAQRSEAVFIVMVNGGEVNEVVFGSDGPPSNSIGGLVSSLDKGSAIIV